MTVLTKMISEKQVQYLQRMRTEKVVPLKHAVYVTDTYLASLTAERAGKAIEYFKGLSYRSSGTIASDGYYECYGSIYKVENGKGLRLFIKPGTKRGKYVRAQGSEYGLADFPKMGKKQAEGLSHQHGFCIACGRTLTNPKSVAQSMGPVCIKKF
jgi:hypothetical protein